MAPTTIASTDHERLEAIATLTEYLHGRYNEQSFRIHEHIEFTYSPASGIMARAIADIPSVGEQLILMLDSERVNFENINMGEAGEVELVTDHGSVSLAAVIQEISRRCPQGQVGLNAKDVSLTALVLYILANKTRFAKVTATWPSREDLAGAFQWKNSSNDYGGLNNTYAAVLVAMGRQAECQVYDEILMPVFDELQVLSHFFPPDEEDTREAFLYAYTVANSRSHEGKGTTSADVIPVVELLNGLPDQSVRVNVTLSDEIGQDAVSGEATACTAVVNKRPLLKGEELIISYGNLPPSSFIFKYGCCPDAYVKERLMTDVVELRIDPSLMAPSPSDINRIACLEQLGYPASAEDMQDFSMFLDPDSLSSYHGRLRGLGEDLSLRRTAEEPEMVKLLRQFVTLTQVASEEQVQRARTNDNLRFELPADEVGKRLVEVIDYNLHLLTSPDKTNAEELEALPTLNGQELTAAMGRIMSRDALAQW
jgi:hypothetical protein